MSSHRIHTRRPFALLAAVLAGFALALVGGPAFAHDELIGSTPAAGSQVDELPTEIVMTFSGVLLDESGATEVVVTDASGTSLVAGDPVLDGTKLTQPLEGSATGEVTVIWRVVSSDGHPVSDQFTFTVAGSGGAGGETAAPIATASPLPGPSMESTDFTWIWIVLGVVIVGLGGALVAVLVAKSRGPRRD